MDEHMQRIKICAGVCDKTLWNMEQMKIGDSTLALAFCDA